MGRINENLKLGHNFYCSRECEFQYKSKKQSLACENCGKTFLRIPSEISPHNYCSKSCAAIVNNKKYPKRQVQLRICRNAECNKQFKGSVKYCSRECKLKALRRYAPQQIMDIIKQSAQELKRVPTKRELRKLESPCRKTFGSWNNAIIAAGLQPNRSHSQRMYKRINTVALDGHFCDSVSEALVDNWFAKNGIFHERNVSYPEANHKADWAIFARRRKIFVEYFGLANDSPRYDRAVKKKKALCHKHKLTLVAIYSQDIYPKECLDNNLRDKFKKLINF